MTNTHQPVEAKPTLKTTAKSGVHADHVRVDEPLLAKAPVPVKALGAVVLAVVRVDEEGEAMTAGTAAPKPTPVPGPDGSVALGTEGDATGLTAGGGGGGGGDAGMSTYFGNQIDLGLTESGRSDGLRMSHDSVLFAQAAEVTATDASGAAVSTAVAATSPMAVLAIAAGLGLAAAGGGSSAP